MAPVVTNAQAASAGLPFASGSLYRDVPFRLQSPFAALVKRVEDLFLSALLLLVTSPFMLMIVLAIKLGSRGPVLFAQPRFGLHGSMIQVLKFRTMYTDCEDQLAMRQTSRDDPRVTRIGAFLRAHSLDELPQLFNVLDGSMSIVGPRPHTPTTTAAGHGLELVVPNYTARYRVKPGITGWAQVCGWRGNLDSIEKAVRRVEHDLYYIDNWSLGFDILIMLKSLGVVLHDRQAF